MTEKKNKLNVQQWEITKKFHDFNLGVRCIVLASLKGPTLWCLSMARTAK